MKYASNIRTHQRNLKNILIKSNQLELNGMQTANKLRKIQQNHYIFKKVWIFLLLVSLIGSSLIISCNFFNQNINKKSHDTPLNIVIQNFTTEKHRQTRILVDTQINTWTVNDQKNPSIASLSDGNFVVVWQSNLQNGSNYGIYGQIFYSNGAKKGNEFSVNNYTHLNQVNPKVATSSSGKFMVV